MRARDMMTERPRWIRGKALSPDDAEAISRITDGLGLKTVCEEAVCPNKGECWKQRHISFMILGDVCTRNCRFCGVGSGNPAAPDPAEPERLAMAAKRLGKGYMVITSVTRDDLRDGGTEHFMKAVSEILKVIPTAKIELLIPDLKADRENLRKIFFSGASVVGHNIETAGSLYADIRPMADYKRSLTVLKELSTHKKNDPRIFIKSSMMVGLGEDMGSIRATLKDVAEAGADIVYIGQYLRPSPGLWPVKKYYTTDEFEEIGAIAHDMGFRAVKAGSFVRSSYGAGAVYEELRGE
ncbi:MAG: lipoyl synthase [Candidatus Omnitrophica bacterium]|nr:lipoyl synthase [Candidatus Omnitrophota bacterium]